MSYFEKRVLLKPVLGGVASVAYFITGHEQTQCNRVCYFHFFGIFLASKRSDYSEFILVGYSMKQKDTIPVITEL